MTDLEQALVELAERLEVPGQDRLVGAVLGRIGEPVQGRPARRAAVRWAVAALIVIAVAVAALPGPRHAVARWLGFDSVRIETNVTLPTTFPPATTTPTTRVAEPTSSATSTIPPAPALDLGAAVSIEEAMSRTGLPDPTPALLGAPQSIHVVQPPTVGQIVEVYAPSDLVPQSPVTGVAALVSVFPGTIDEGYFGKMLFDQATWQSVDVAGSPGYWIEGAPHQLYFQTGDESEIQTLRLATNTLLWLRDGNVYRVEADVSMETALRIAASVD